MPVEISHEQGAINGPGHSLLVYAARHPGARLRLICAEAVQASESPATAPTWRAASNEVVVAWRGCLAQMPPAIVLELLGLGAAQVCLDATGCATPHWPVDYAELAASLGVPDRLRYRAADEAPTADDTANAALVKVFWADGIPVLRRRSLFAPASEHTESDEDLPEMPDESLGQQARLRAAARIVADPQAAVETTVAAWGAVQLHADGCQASGVCVQACPTNALALESVENRAMLAYDPSLCTGCELCMRICDAHALSANRRLGGAALLKPAQVLAAFDVAYCEKCKTIFRPHHQDELLCAVCAYRAENPFGSTLPPWANLPPEIAANWPTAQ